MDKNLNEDNKFSGDDWMKGLDSNFISPLGWHFIDSNTIQFVGTGGYILIAGISAVDPRMACILEYLPNTQAQVRYQTTAKI